MAYVMAICQRHHGISVISAAAYQHGVSVARHLGWYGTISINQRKANSVPVSINNQQRHQQCSVRGVSAAAAHAYGGDHISSSAACMMAA